MSARPSFLFVYGTLLPGQSRWPLLVPYVVDEGLPDSVPGALYDTGQGYPAAVFGPGPTNIHGCTFGLLADSLDQALDHLDRIEGAVIGLYQRIILTTDRGLSVWTYEYGAGLDLTPIASGSWVDRAG